MTQGQCSAAREADEQDEQVHQTSRGHKAGRALGAAGYRVVSLPLPRRVHSYLVVKPLRLVILDSRMTPLDQALAVAGSLRQIV